MNRIMDLLQDVHEKQLYERVLNAHQQHVFDWWPDLTELERRALLRQISYIDFDLLGVVVRKLLNAEKEDFSHLTPVQSTILEGKKLLKFKKIGEHAIRDGKVCSLVLAGGQGTRLGFVSPKGMYPIGPVSGKSLFQWFAEKIRFINQRFDSPIQIPWLIMTNEFTDAQIKLYFHQNDFFGLREDDVYFFKQGLLPAIDFQGKLLMDAKNHICENPDGHGGVISALGKSGLLEKMTQQGIQHIFVHNIDNCLTKVCDTAFLGYHMGTDADFTCKSLPKHSPDETLGTIIDAKGKIRIIEYSDIPKDVAELKNENGQLVFKDGSINTYLIKVDFLRWLYQEKFFLPVHCMRKKIRVLDSNGRIQDPQEPNGIKLETKLFDILLNTQKAGVVRVNRSEEFSPLKNSDGLESYGAVYNDLQALFWKWIENAGIQLPAGRVEKIEISPLFAVDQDTFLEKATAIGLAAFTKKLEIQIEDKGWISL